MTDTAQPTPESEDPKQTSPTPDAGSQLDSDSGKAETVETEKAPQEQPAQSETEAAVSTPDSTEPVEPVVATIRLDQFLQACGVPTGGQAKRIIQGGEVLLNGEVETRRKKKLVVGDEIGFDGGIFEVAFGPDVDSDPDVDSNPEVDSDPEVEIEPDAENNAEPDAQ